MNFPSSYTAIERLHGVGSGFSVRARNAGGAEVLLKTTSATNDVWLEGGGDNVAEQARFEAAKRREQAAAAAAPECFVAGSIERYDGNVFWVRPFSPGTLRDWVAFKEVPSPKRLSAVCLAIIRGLITLVRLDGGGHGNLTLGNVLLDGKSEPGVRLVDPIEADRAKVQSDKRALGLIIYQLVRSETIQLDANLTGVAEDEDWRRLLGKLGDQWKALCNDLLNPYSALSQGDWVAIEARLKAIGSGQRSHGLLLVVALLLAGGVLFGVFILMQDSEKPVTDLEREQQWDELLDDYFQWGRDLSNSRGESTEISQFAEIFDRDSKAEMDPDQIRKMLNERSGMGAQFDKKQEEARLVLSDVKVLELTKSQQREIERAHRYLRNLRQSIESWKVLSDLVKSREDFAASGFEFGVEQMDRLLARIDFSASFTYADLFELKQAAAGVAGLQNAYRDYKEVLDRMDALDGSAFIRDYGGYLREQIKGAETDPTSLLKRLAANGREAEKLWRDNADTLRTDLFRSAESEFLKTANLSDARVVEEWGQIVLGYRQIDRAAVEQRVETLRAETVGRLRELEQEINDLREPEMEIPDFLGRLNSLSVAYNDTIPADWIEKNRPRFNAALSRFENGVASLEGEARQLLNELSPDIVENLQAMRGDNTVFQHPLLQARWENFRRSAIDGKTEGSFDSALEFKRFRNRYQEQRGRLQEFEQQQLPQLRQAASLNVAGLPEDLASIGQTFREELLNEAEEALVASSVELIFQQEDVSERLDRELKLSQQKFTAAVAELSDYLKDVQQGRRNFSDWEVPEQGYRAYFEGLNASPQRQDWSGDTSMADLLVDIRSASGLEDMRPGALLNIALDQSRRDFIRFLALSGFSKIAAVEVEQLQALGTMVAELEPKISEARRRDWSNVVKTLWITAFKQAESLADRDRAMAVHGDFGVSASDLTGAERFAFELKSAINLLENFAERYEEKPSLLTEFVNSFKTLPDEGARASAGELIRDLEAIDLGAGTRTPTVLPFEAEGWSIVEKTDEKMTLAWADHRQVFHRVPGGSRDIFVSETELSIQLFSDWMGHVGWEPVKTEAVDDFPSVPRNFDYRRGITLWNPPRRGLQASASLRQAEHWFSKFDQPIYTPLSELANDQIPTDLFFEISFDLPVQHLGAKLAGATTNSMGMRLPSPEEWERMVEFEKVGAPSDIRVWSTRWEQSIRDLEGISEFSSKAVAVLNEVRLDSFYGEITGQGKSSAAGPLLVPVVQGGQSPFKHLAGNVAEFLYDSNTARFYVAGGSALAEVADTWKNPIVIAPKNENFMYSDVGLRLCFDAPVKSATQQFINKMKDTWESL